MSAGRDSTVLEDRTPQIHQNFFARLECSVQMAVQFIRSDASKSSFRLASERPVNQKSLSMSFVAFI